MLKQKRTKEGDINYVELIIQKKKMKKESLQTGISKKQQEQQKQTKQRREREAELFNQTPIPEWGIG